MRVSAGEESSVSGVAAQTIEAQPASGQIKPKEDAAVRARHDRGIGDAWLAVGPSKDRGGAHGQKSLGLCRRRLKVSNARAIAWAICCSSSVMRSVPSDEAVARTVGNDPRLIHGLRRRAAEWRGRLGMGDLRHTQTTGGYDDKAA
jgi:hypothetical protein